MSAVRLYAICASDSLENPHIEAVDAVEFRELAAIVSGTEYSRSPMKPADIELYLSVVASAHSRGSVLPAPPGTVFRSRDNLLRWMELHYYTLLDALSEVEGRSTARLTVSAKQAIGNEDAGKKLQTHAADAFRVLRSSAEATVSRPLDPDEKRIVAKASFLVDLENWNNFAETLEAERKRYPDLDFRITGPWPPYDFVQMKFGG